MQFYNRLVQISNREDIHVGVQNFKFAPRFSQNGRFPAPNFVFLEIFFAQTNIGGANASPSPAKTSLITDESYVSFALISKVSARDWMFLQMLDLA